GERDPKGKFYSGTDNDDRDENENIGLRKLSDDSPIKATSAERSGFWTWDGLQCTLLHLGDCYVM
ncbi:MAG: hypothetical protein Q9196_006979, partial [Gyalolechia fulgens]